VCSPLDTELARTGLIQAAESEIVVEDGWVVVG
jgi:hypothetical protein